MDSESDYYEEVPSEGEEEVIMPPIANNEPLGVDIPAPGAEAPESPAASPSPVPSDASGPMRLGIEIPLVENMVAPPSPEPVVDYNSEDEAFGAEELRIYSSRSLLGLEMWRNIGGKPGSFTPSLQFRPGLQRSSNPYTGIDGRNIFCQRGECSLRTAGGSNRLE